jgi:hypothetical protein
MNRCSDEAFVNIAAFSVIGIDDFHHLGNFCATAVCSVGYSISLHSDADPFLVIVPSQDQD